MDLRFAGSFSTTVLHVNPTTGEAEPVSADGSFLGETGTIVGWINLPEDDGDSD